MISNAQWMVIQDIFGDGGEMEVPRQNASKSHTMMRIDPALMELQHALAAIPLTLADESDVAIQAALNNALKASPGNWEAFGPGLTPGSCLHPQHPYWWPCGAAGGSGGIVKGRVFALRRNDNAKMGDPTEIRIRSEFHAPVSRVFITRYCAFVQYEVSP